MKHNNESINLCSSTALKMNTAQSGKLMEEFGNFLNGLTALLSSFYLILILGGGRHFFGSAGPLHYHAIGKKQPIVKFLPGPAVFPSILFLEN
jgi:hypothetical protein